MKYKIFISDSIEMLENEQFIGEANTWKEVCHVIDQYLTKNKIHQEPYWRYLFGEVATFIDYGSWSKFGAIIPPISIEKMMKED